jgi:hypothetical protein
MKHKIELTLDDNEARELFSWLDARLDEMTGEEASIEEEAPGLLEALRLVRKAVDVPKARKTRKR